MPIYEISTDGEDQKRLVKATSASAAISHCARGRFSARVVTKVEDAYPLFDAGVKLETAGAPEVEERQSESKQDEQRESESTADAEVDPPANADGGGAPKAKGGAKPVPA